MDKIPPATVPDEDQAGDGAVVAISASRLAYLEACEGILRAVIHPRSESGHIDAEMEGASRFARTWTDEQIENATRGSSMWDDPPKAWRKPKILTYFRGELVGRGIVARNVGQHYEVFLRASRDPVAYWRRWRLGYLEMHQGDACSAPSCSGTGHFVVDEALLGLACDNCGAFFSYEQVRDRQERASRQQRKACKKKAEKQA